MVISLVGCLICFLCLCLSYSDAYLYKAGETRFVIGFRLQPNLDLRDGEGLVEYAKRGWRSGQGVDNKLESLGQVLVFRLLPGSECVGIVDTHSGSTRGTACTGGHYCLTRQPKQQVVQRWDLRSEFKGLRILVWCPLDGPLQSQATFPVSRLRDSPPCGFEEL